MQIRSQMAWILALLLGCHLPNIPKPVNPRSEAHERVSVRSVRKHALEDLVIAYDECLAYKGCEFNLHFMTHNIFWLGAQGCAWLMNDEGYLTRQQVEAITKRMGKIGKKGRLFGWKKSLTPEEQKELRDLLRAYLKANGFAVDRK